MTSRLNAVFTSLSVKNSVQPCILIKLCCLIQSFFKPSSNYQFISCCPESEERIVLTFPSPSHLLMISLFSVFCLELPPNQNSAISLKGLSCMESSLHQSNIFKSSGLLFSNCSFSQLFNISSRFLCNVTVRDNLSYYMAESVFAMRLVNLRSVTCYTDQNF